MNTTKFAVVLALIAGLHLQSVAPWRRRRRVSRSLHLREMDASMVSPVQKLRTWELCTSHGEYIIKKGHVLPCDRAGRIVQGLNCNSEFCWKDSYCWQCRLKHGSKKFRRVNFNKIGDIVCEDFQCPYGKRDIGLDYYTTNSTRSMPIANGPFSCNTYLCLSSDKCWKCRLNDAIGQLQVITKGPEFDSRVTCCPLPKVLFSKMSTKGGYFTAGDFKAGVMNSPTTDSDDELIEEHFATIEFPAKKVVTSFALIKNEDTSEVTLSYSQDGISWSTYREYNRQTVFRGSPAPGDGHRTLLKPLVLRYLRLIPLRNDQNIVASIFVLGCDIHSSD